MPRGENGNELKWGYAFAGALALGFAALIEFAFGDLTPEGVEALPSFLAVAYELAGKHGLTVPLAILGVVLLVWEVAKPHGRPKPVRPDPATAAVKATLATVGTGTGEMVPIQAGPVEPPPPTPAKNGKIRGGWHGSGAARRGKTVHTSEEGEEVTHEGPMTMEPIARGDGKSGRVKLATERFMNWGTRPE
jgi:hypothetical protein